ncbi:MAG TPA: hypothetical protein VFT12_09385, partial [Thermoanaerobaculia bacterium]|nr:hypothetical protein [Thermoanaerobaculia bacterium]
MRRVLPIALALFAFVVLSILWIVSDRRASQRIFDHYSAANTSAGGLSLAAAYLGNDRKVSLLTQPIARASLEKNAVVFRVVESVPLRFDPETLAEDQFGPPRPNRSPLLTDAEEAFVRRGGRMIIAAPSGTVPSTDIQDNIARKVFPIWPPLGDLEICECAKGFTALGPRMHAIYTAGTCVIVAREPIGGGELFLVSTPEIF